MEISGLGILKTEKRETIFPGEVYGEGVKSVGDRFPFGEEGEGSGPETFLILPLSL